MAGNESVSECRMATSCSSTSSHAPGMILEDVFELCRRDKGEIGKWLRRHEVIGDFSRYGLPIMPQWEAQVSEGCLLF